MAQAATERPWPFGVPDEAYGVGTSENGRVVRMVNLSFRGDKDTAARWLRGAMLALGILAVAAAVVSFAAQFAMVYHAKDSVPIAALEAGIPDAAALIFAALGIALALHGKRAIRPRLLNLGAVAASITMNLLAAGNGWRDLAIWVMPPVAYALASDTAIGVIRAHALAVHRGDLADEDTTPLAVLGGVALWILRLTLAAPSTLSGFRAWVVAECPSAPQPRALTMARDAAAEATAVADKARTSERRAIAAAARAEDDAESARDGWEKAEKAIEELTAELAKVRGERDEVTGRAEALASERDRALGQAEALTRALAEVGRQAPARAPREGTKTARFLARVAEVHGPLARIPLDQTARIAAEVAGEIELDEGSARRELRNAVLAAQTEQAGRAS